MQALGKAGKVLAQALKSSMRFGASGLKAVARGCWRSLDRMIALARKYAPYLWWLLCQWALSKIPFWLALLLEIILISILVKTWGGRWLNPASRPA